MLSKCLLFIGALFSTVILPSVAFCPSCNARQKLHPHSALFASDNKHKNLSASSKEKREEEKRRLERKTDVVIGKTSAKPEARDYPLNIKSTEEEWMRQASKVEQLVFIETEKGMKSLKMLQLEEADESFDKVFQLRPESYLWQAGIAKFYLDDLKGAANVFVNSVDYYENKFLEPASEERIWRDACELKLLNSMGKAERKSIEKIGGMSSVITQIPERDENEELLNAETRKVLRIARDLFAATLEGNHGKEVLARAKLRAICGSPNDKPRFDPKMWKISAWFYLGLHYDVVGDEEASRECMKNALRLCPSSGNGEDIIHTLPLLHMARRDLFDDDEFEAVDDSIESGDGNLLDQTSHRIANGGSGITSDPVFLESIRNSISKMRYVDLQSALEARGLKFHDSKEALQKKLFRSLLEDSGLDEYQ